MVVLRQYFLCCDGCLCAVMYGFHAAMARTCSAANVHKDFVLSQINKLKKEEDYTRVIKEGGEPLSPVLPTDPAPLSSKQGPAAKRPKKGRKNLKDKTQKQVEEEPEPDPLEHLAGVGQLQAEAYNMNDMKQVIELVEFLHMNGEWELFITPKDGQCMWAAFRRGMEVV